MKSFELPTGGIQGCPRGADCVRVERGTAFAALLDEKLREAVDSARLNTSHQTREFALPHPLLFARAYHPARNVAHYFAPMSTAHSRETCRSRPLSPGQQRALAELNARGAGLRPDFTATELRKAYRALARTYHPDRHRARSAGDQATLSRVFADIVAHHGTLMHAIVPQPSGTR